jgi:hypothetical protein
LAHPRRPSNNSFYAKLRSNYIYNLAYSDQLAVGKFNIVLELAPLDGGQPFRTLAGLVHIPGTRRIRLVTFFG